MILMFNATDLVTVGFLIFLEGILSLDNALVLALMVRGLPGLQRKRALYYGILGAFTFRFVSLFALSYLMHASWVKFIGGGYLFWIAASHFLGGSEPADECRPSVLGFWRTVLMVEVMDIAFSVDSILASVSLSQNYFVVFLGGALGIVMMRFAANQFVPLLKRFPKFERTAYLLVLVIGLKLIIQGFDVEFIDFHSSKSAASWLFWGAMSLAVFTGFGSRSSDLALAKSR